MRTLTAKPAANSGICRRVALAVMLCVLPLGAQESMQGHALRSLSGTVTDPHHEPLRGAVVKLQVGDTPNITTFITGTDGRYTFKRLDGNVDYKVWATFRERSSKPREISKFSAKMETEIDFTLETF